MKETIELKRRTPEEREAYIQGIEAGARIMGPGKPTLVLEYNILPAPGDYEIDLDKIMRQVMDGVVLLPPYIRYKCTIADNSSVELVVKTAKEVADL